VNVSRRKVIMGMAAALTAPPVVAVQSGARVQRVGIYSAPPVRDALIEVLRERGWVEGSNIAFAWRAEDSEARVGEYLASTPTDVLVMGGPHRIRAAMRATKVIPIIGVDLESDSSST